MNNIVNIVGLTVGWWSCIIGAAWEIEWIGPVVVVAHLSWYVSQSTKRLREVVFLLGAALVGFLLDTTLSWNQLITYASPFVVAWISPIWMVVLWPNFATSLTRSLGFLRKRIIVSCVVGGVGGTLAYWGGAELGALQLGDDALFWIALEWAIALPLLVLMAPAQTFEASESKKVEVAA